MRAASSENASKTERLREIWKKTAAVRLAVGVVLLAGSAAAVASGAFAVVGGIAAVRAGIAGTGAFLTVDGLLRSCGMEKNVTAVSMAVAVSVAAILAMPVAEAADVFSSASMTVVPSGVPSVPIPIPDVSPTFSPAAPLTPETVREIFADIRADHPGQHYVTLEQSVRRIEGLSHGIPLSESFRLASEVPTAHSLVTDPSGKIVRAMESLGMLPETHGTLTDSATFDSAARKLTQSDMETVLLKAYGAGSKAIATDIVPSESHVSAIATQMPISTPPPRTSFLVGLAALISAPLGIAAYFRFWKKRPDARSSESDVQKSAPEEGTPESVSVTAIPPVSIARTVPMPPVHLIQSPVSAPDVTPIYPALRLAVFDVLTGEYGFEAVPATTGVFLTDRPRPYFSLPTPVGEFRSSLVESADGAKFRFSWTESQSDRFVTEHDVPVSGEPNEIRNAVRKALEDAYFEAAEYREKTKAEELREVRTFEVSKRDCAAVYAQLEAPETVKSNRETGGFWFGSGYGVKDGVFRFRNLANPLPEQIDASSVEFAIRDEHWEGYVGSNVSKAFRADFSPGERKLFSKALERASRNAKNANPFPLAVDFFNWHKHPGAPLGPSGGDINHPDSASGKFEDSPTLPVVTFAIANTMSAAVRIMGKGMWNSCVLKGEDFG